MWCFGARLFLMERDARWDHRLPDLFTAEEWKVLASRLELTPRQAQIARWVCRGYATAGVAEQLGVSPETVRTHSQALFKKLDIHDRVGVPVRLVLAHRTLRRRK